MARKESYTKYENKLLPSYRQRISQAESTEDVKKFFVYTVTELLGNVFGEKMKFHYEDVALAPESEPAFILSERLKSSDDFSSIWKESDLSHVLSRLAEPAVSRYRHLEKHPERTDAKIRTER